jgi:hypothetical protein
MQINEGLYPFFVGQVEHGGLSGATEGLRGAAEEDVCDETKPSQTS